MNCASSPSQEQFGVGVHAEPVLVDVMVLAHRVGSNLAVVVLVRAVELVAV